jgi:ABC-type sugar transport system permease subunit/ABC-type glycerol-3-phosphate transport system substrate-binding protein
MNRVWALLILALAIRVSALSSPVTIRYACTDGAESIPYIDQIVAEFERAHPNIHVKIEPIVSGADYKNKLLAMVAANIAPDTARMGQADYRSFAIRSAILPLDPFLRDSPEVNLRAYYENVVGYFSYEGHLWVLPRAISSNGLVFYNKRLFREAGLAYPDGTWTWDFAPRPELGAKDFFTCVQRLTKRLPGGKTIQFGYSTSWPQLWMWTLLDSSGLSLWNDDIHPTRMTATDPNVLRVFMLASDTENKFHWLPSNNDITTNNSNVHDEFVKGHVAMMQSGAWECKTLREDMKDPWDVTVVPAFRNEPIRTLGELTGTAIFSSTRHPKECWEFVKWMDGPHGMIPLAKAGLDQPAIRSLALSKAWLPGDGISPEHLSITDKAAAAVTLHLTPEYFAPIDDMCGGIEYDVMTGAGNPKDKLQYLQAKASRGLAIILEDRASTKPFPFWPALAIGICIALAGIFWIYAPERGQKYTRTEKKESRSAYLFLAPWIVGMLGLTVGPMIYSFLLSFAESDIIQSPVWRGLGNYAQAIDPNRDDTFWVSLRVTFTYALMGIPLGITSALALALLLNQKVKGVAIWRALYYVPSLASGVAVSLIWMKVFNPETGLLNALIYGPDGHRNFLGLGSLLSRIAGTPDQPINWLGNPHTVIPAFVIMGVWGAGGGTIIFLAGLQGISQTYYEAATLDGAGVWARFRNVTFPMLTPTIFFSVITGIIGALQAFTQAFVMTSGGPDRATMFYVLNLYQQAFGHLRMGYASALAWILFVIILAITAVQLALSKRWVFYEGGIK